MRMMLRLNVNISCTPNLVKPLRNLRDIGLPKIHDPVILVVLLAHITNLAKRSGSICLGRCLVSGWWHV
jgi:hypothetical protein